MQNEIISKKLCVPLRITAKVWLPKISSKMHRSNPTLSFSLLSSSQNGNGTTVLSDHTSFVLQL
ncbi:hypothetical protein Bca101_099337 [Brassica carinata]